jgi:hypothetical protein
MNLGWVRHFSIIKSYLATDFYKDVSVLFMLSDFQPYAVSIRLKFVQHKQSRYVLIKNQWRSALYSLKQISLPMVFKVCGSHHITNKFQIRVHKTCDILALEACHQNFRNLVKLLIMKKISLKFRFKILLYFLNFCMVFI